MARSLSKFKVTLLVPFLEQTIEARDEDEALRMFKYPYTFDKNEPHSFIVTEGNSILKDNDLKQVREIK